MTLTPARTDLPSVGAKIVVMHGGGQFYVGPHDVLSVYSSQFCRPEGAEIDRGLSYVCGNDPYGGEGGWSHGVFV